MKITNDMIHPELRQKAVLIRTIFPYFRSSSFKLIHRLQRFTRKKIDASIICEEYVTSDSVKVFVYKPATSPTSRTGMLWMHGGGYAFGSPKDDAGFINSLVLETNCVVVAPDYRLSTSAPYPAALEDCYSALLWMKNNAQSLGINPNQLFAAGDSAGGGLTAAISIYARDKKEVAIAFQMPLYPMLDDMMSTNSMKNNNAPIWNEKSNVNAWSLYLKDLYQSNKVPPYAAPSRLQDFSNLPPAFTYIGSLDPFFDETIAYFHKLREAHVEASCITFEKCFHAFEVLFPNSTPSKRAKALMIENLKKAQKKYFATQELS
ncbi:MAG: alpha/beta hydrolase [Anaerorhabdus sp.]